MERMRPAAAVSTRSGFWQGICLPSLQRCWAGARSILQPLRWPPLRTWFRTLRLAAVAAVEHDALTVAQAVAYSAMMALFPALIVAAAVVGLLPHFLPLRTQLALFFERIVMLTLMEGFRRAHGLPVVRGSFFERRVRALALVPLSLVPMAAASALVVFGHVLTHSLAGAVPPSLRPAFVGLVLAVRWTVALAGSTGILAVIYHLGTDPTAKMWDRLQPWLREPWNLLRHQWSWRASLPGATLATALWFFSTLGFGAYVTRYANYSRVYGSLGAGIALMIWLYLIALCVLIGSEFNAQRTLARKGAKTS